MGTGCGMHGIGLFGEPARLQCRLLTYYPVKMLLHDLPRKGPFSCIPARSCEILQDLARFCGNAREKNPFLKDLARAFLLGNIKAILASHKAIAWLW